MRTLQRYTIGGVALWIGAAWAQEYEAIAGWFPQSNVGNEKLIDLDQQEIATLLSELTFDSFALAQEIYANGKHADGYSLRGLSAQSDVTMRVNGTGEYFPTFQAFVDYYGSFDFADRMIDAAYDGTDVVLEDKAFNFGTYTTLRGRAEFIEKSTAFGNALLFAIRELDVAVDSCQSASSNSSSSNTTYSAASSSGIDKAVAFWTGSLEGTDGLNAGVLSYALADGRCIEFKTCSEGNATEGKAVVNTKLFTLFESMRDSLTENDCDSAAKYRDNAIQVMFIPVIQSTLLYAYRQSGRFDTSDAEEGAGAAYVASILPQIAACNAQDAETIFNSMRVNGDFITDFDDVKAALENNYPCLGITCDEVGGIYDSASMSYTAEPCGIGGTGTNRTNETDATATPTVAPATEPISINARSHTPHVLSSRWTTLSLAAMTLVMGLLM